MILPWAMIMVNQVMPEFMYGFILYIYIYIEPLHRKAPPPRRLPSAIMILLPTKCYANQVSFLKEGNARRSRLRSKLCRVGILAFHHREPLQHTSRPLGIDTLSPSLANGDGIIPAIQLLRLGSTIRWTAMLGAASAESTTKLTMGLSKCKHILNLSPTRNSRMDCTWFRQQALSL